ncbi:peptide/nickel transport system ATP-binding protein [Nakamurella sp. UYEF19]|uniref:ABC transporter ATP-binding protein n=1 Tax=Nakamurella sp. UYEF19 TaxID=1756392 RepID=UPI0033984934
MNSPASPVETDDSLHPAVEITDVWRRFTRPKSSPFARTSTVDALADVSLSIPRGSRFGIVGESGSGKTTLMRLIAGLDQATSGTVKVGGTDLTGLREGQLGFLRKSLQIVFQDPMGSLDPRMRVRNIVAEPLQVQGIRDVDAAVATALEQVGLPPDAGRRYPHQFSGGQRQRISIARAIAPEPEILLADEAVSALDVTVRAQILALLESIAMERQLTLIFVSHDLAVVRRVCDQVAVLQNGRLIETGPTESLYRSPQQRYTRELLAAVPTLAKSLAAAGARQSARGAGVTSADSTDEAGSTA